MAQQERSGLNEAAEISAHAAGAVRGAIKTGKAVSGAAKGAAAAGPYGAAAAALWTHRKAVAAIIAGLLVLPFLFIMLLPSLIFGGLTKAGVEGSPDTPILNDNAAIVENINQISQAISDLLEEGQEDVRARIEADFAASSADQKEIINPYESSPAYNANRFIAMYCAAKNQDYTSISLKDMEALIRKAKDSLYTFTSTEEPRTTTVTDTTIDEKTGKVTVTETEVTEIWKIYTIVYNGEAYFEDMFISRQPKARMVQRLGQQLRINRSKIKDASDTNTDFDDLDGAIRSGYFLKEGLGNNEDFYYLNLLITVTASTVDELEWKVNEMKKLLMSRDMDVCSCAFHEEQAFLSSLPLVSMEKHLYERSKRNALTTGVASCYPFTSYELSDENGILFGLNKYNNSPVIIDIFDSKVYKNANIAVCGTSGAGKTFLILLMALRMRRKGIQVFMLAPLKGHEFHRACVNTGGEFIRPCSGMA